MGCAPLAGAAGLPQEFGRPNPIAIDAVPAESRCSAEVWHPALRGLRRRSTGRSQAANIGRQIALAAALRLHLRRYRAGRREPSARGEPPQAACGVASAAPSSSRMGNRRTIRSSLAAPSATPRRRLEQLSPRGLAPSLTLRCSRAGRTGPSLAHRVPEAPPALGGGCRPQTSAAQTGGDSVSI